MKASTISSLFLDFTTDAALNLVAWSIICNIKIPLIYFKSAATTSLNPLRKKADNWSQFGFFTF